jgi:hypothetical protein
MMDATGVQGAFSRPCFFLAAGSTLIHLLSCIFLMDDGRAFFSSPFTFPSLYFLFPYLPYTTMGIVHTVRSRIELWRLERYTRRRSCQLPGYTYKGKNG